MKKLSVLLVVVMLATLFAACGAPAAPAVAPTEAPAAVTQPTEAPAAEPTKEAAPAVEPTKEPAPAPLSDCDITPPQSPTNITLIGWSIPVIDVYTAAMQSCNDVDNVTVNLRVMDNASAIEQMNLAFAAGGDSPFAIVQQSNGSIQRNVWNDWLMPIDDLVDKYREEYNLDDIGPGHWQGVTFNGKIYGIPVGSNAIMLMYRKDLFDKYNLQAPTTYDEIISACETLKQEPEITAPFAMDLSAGWAWSIAFYEALRSLGGDFFVEGTAEPAFNNEIGVKALTKIKELADACMGANNLAIDSASMRAGLGNGSMGFVHTWATSGATVTDEDQSDYYDKIAFAPAASVEAGSKLAGSAWGDYFAIPANFKGDRDLVFRIMMEAIRPDHQATASKLGMVTRDSALTGGGVLPFAQAALETIDKGIGPMPRNIAYPTLDATLGNWLPLVGTGELTPAEALQKAEDDYITQAKDKGYLK